MLTAPEKVATIRYLMVMRLANTRERYGLVFHDFGMDYNLGAAAKEVELFLSIEGVRQ